MNLGKPIIKSIKEYSRGVIGGLLFSFPLLYTMEVWWSGYTSKPLSLLLLVLFTFVVLLGYNRYAGMHPGVGWKNIVMETFEEMGIGFLVSLIVLYLLNRIDIKLELYDSINKVIIEAMLVSIGVSVGTAQMGSSTNGKEEADVNANGEEEEKEPIDDRESQKDYNHSKSTEVDKTEADSNTDVKPDRRTGKIALVILSICGSLLVSMSVAPTDEVWVLAVQSKPFQILLISILSIALSMVTGYFSNFKGADKSELKPTAREILFVTSLCYVSSLFVSGFLLWFFGRFDELSFQNIIKAIIVLGAIASLGASAGRMLIK